MVRLAIALAAFTAVGVPQTIDPPSSRAQGRQQCLHGASERVEQRARREAVLKVAHQINLAEMAFRLPAGVKLQYRPASE